MRPTSSPFAVSVTPSTTSSTAASSSLLPPLSFPSLHSERVTPCLLYHPPPPLLPRPPLPSPLPSHPSTTTRAPIPAPTSTFTPLIQNTPRRMTDPSTLVTPLHATTIFTRSPWLIWPPAAAIPPTLTSPRRALPLPPCPTSSAL